MFNLEEEISICSYSDGVKITLEGHTCLVRNCILGSNKKHTTPGKSSILLFPTGAYRIHCWACDRQGQTKLPEKINIQKLTKQLLN